MSRSSETSRPSLELIDERGKGDPFARDASFSVSLPSRSPTGLSWMTFGVDDLRVDIRCINAVPAETDLWGGVKGG